MVLDQGQQLPGRPLTLVRAGKLVLAIPEALLGAPDRLLVGATRGSFPWRAIDLPRAEM